MRRRRLQVLRIAVAFCMAAAVTWSVCATAAPAAGADTPQVTKIDPARVARGSQLTVKVSGQNFANGAKVSFANPGITVLATNFEKSSELAVQIRIATDAAAGATSLFVVNPDDSEVEAPFTVSEETVAATPATGSDTGSGGGATAGSASKSSPASDSKGAANKVQFDVLSLGELASVLTSQNKASGTLGYAAGKLIYMESGSRVFAVKPSDVKEIGPNTILGMNTGSFHVILNSGKTYNFMAASLKPADSLSIIDALRRALH